MTIPCTVFSNATVSVAKDAVLETTDEIVISKLALDGSVAGNGTISGFTFAAEGELSIGNLGSKDRVEIDVDASGSQGIANLARWNLSATAVGGSRVRCKVVVSGGRVLVCRRGIVVNFR